VKIGWYDKIKEPDLEKEKELFDLIYWFINVGAEDPGDWNLDSYYELFKRLKKDYPEILNSNISGDSYIYRGTVFTPKQLKELINTHTLIDKKNYYIIKDYKYSSRRKISSWTTNFTVAGGFATDVYQEGNYGVVVRTLAKNAELFFNPKFILTMFNHYREDIIDEEEIFNATNPILTDVILPKSIYNKLISSND
jgi:hypothetical protein